MTDFKDFKVPTKLDRLKMVVTYQRALASLQERSVEKHKEVEAAPKKRTAKKR